MGPDCARAYRSFEPGRARERIDCRHRILRQAPRQKLPAGERRRKRASEPSDRARCALSTQVEVPRRESRKSIVLYRASMLAQIRLFGVGHGVGKTAGRENWLAVFKGAWSCWADTLSANLSCFG